MNIKKFLLSVIWTAGLVLSAEIQPAELLSLGLMELQSVPRLSGKEVTLNFYQAPAAVFIPTDNYEIHAEITAKEITPVVYVNYTIYADQKFIKGFRIRYNAAAFADAYYAKHRLHKGESVSADDFYILRTDIIRYARYLTVPYNDWMNRVLTADIGQDEPLFAWMLGVKQLVNAGDIVTLVVVGDGVTVRTKAKALQPGLLGDKIRVQVQNEKKRLLQAEITAAGECRVVL